MLCAAFSVLSDGTRLRVVRALVVAVGGLAAGAIARTSSASDHHRMSFASSALAEAGGRHVVVRGEVDHLTPPTTTCSPVSFESSNV